LRKNHKREAFAQPAPLGVAVSVRYQPKRIPTCEQVQRRQNIWIELNIFKPMLQVNLIEVRRKLGVIAAHAEQSTAKRLKTDLF
jgi:hypothetical protein